MPYPFLPWPFRLSEAAALANTGHEEERTSNAGLTHLQVPSSVALLYQAGKEKRSSSHAICSQFTIKLQIK